MIAIISIFIGISGFAYGFWKDAQMRTLERRAKGPHFSDGIMLIDSVGASYPSGGKPSYDYGSVPRLLTDELRQMEFGGSITAIGYPKDRIAGLRVWNTGEGIRYFTVSSKHPLKVFERPSNRFDINYSYSSEEHGKEVRFELSSESVSGYQLKQVWAIRLGETYIKRVCPK